MKFRLFNQSLKRKIRKVSLVFICGCLFSVIVHAKTPESAYQFLNKYRQMAGLVIFDKNFHLEQSAANHAQYMAHNNHISHFQQKNAIGYTGTTVAQRARITGYESQNVTENISVGQNDVYESIDALFETLYHRLLFLSLTQNEVGISYQDTKPNFFVFNMGNRQLDKICRYSGIQNSEQYYTNLCNHIEKVPVDKINDIHLENQKNNPPLVLWPPDKSQIATIGFWEEHPNPLANNQISGYPITIQFNPFYFRNVQLSGIHLFEVSTNFEIRGLLIQQQNDRQKILDKNQFALFPYQLLKWGTQYRVLVKFLANGKYQTKNWSFYTKRLTLPKISIKGEEELLLLKPDQDYLIEIEARKANEMIRKLKWEHESAITVFVNKFYYNLLQVRLSGEFCKTTKFLINNKRQFSLQLSKKEKILKKYHHRNRLNNGCRD